MKSECFLLTSLNKNYNNIAAPTIIVIIWGNLSTRQTIRNKI